MFKATADDVTDHGNGVVNIGQIAKLKTPFAKAELTAIFPAAMGSVATSLRMMTDVHFEICKSLPQHIKTLLKHAKSKYFNSWRSKQEDIESNRTIFLEFCLNLCRKHNIINRTPALTGLVLGQQAMSTKRERSDMNQQLTQSSTRHQSYGPYPLPSQVDFDQGDLQGLYHARVFPQWTSSLPPRIFASGQYGSQHHQSQGYR